MSMQRHGMAVDSGGEDDGAVGGPHRSSGCTARRRRQQKQRAEARHAQWLIGLVQAKHSHHTGVGLLQGLCHKGWLRSLHPSIASWQFFVSKSLHCRVPAVAFQCRKRVHLQFRLFQGASNTCLRAVMLRMLQWGVPILQRLRLPSQGASITSLRAVVPRMIQGVCGLAFTCGSSGGLSMSMLGNSGWQAPGLLPAWADRTGPWVKQKKRMAWPPPIQWFGCNKLCSAELQWSHVRRQ